MVFHHKEVNFTLVTAQKETKSWLNLFFLARRIFKGKTCAIYAVSDSKWPVLKNMAKMCPTFNASGFNPAHSMGIIFQHLNALTNMSFECRPSAGSRELHF
jgi:hypothetical protein